MEESGIGNACRRWESPTYYSQGMAALPPRPARRRPRLGSLERPVNGRLYRGTWLLVGIPLLLAAFSVRKAEPLPLARACRPPSTAPRRRARDAAGGDLPGPLAGNRRRRGRATWFARAARALRARGPRPTASARTVPGRGREPLVNLVTDRPGSSPDEIVVMAHRDDSGAGPGANDNASGTAALSSLRARTRRRRSAGARVQPAAHARLRLTDGGAFGALGARASREHSPYAATSWRRSTSTRSPARAAAARPRGDAAPARRTGARRDGVSARPASRPARRPARPARFAQLLDLAFPFTLLRPGAAPCPRNTGRSR